MSHGRSLGAVFLRGKGIFLSLPYLIKFRGIIGPLLVHNKIAFGIQVLPHSAQWREAVIFSSLSKGFANKDMPSPRYWLMWPGVLAMTAISFTGEWFEDT
jgi:hypothetical protein